MKLWSKWLPPLPLINSFWELMLPNKNRAVNKESNDILWTHYVHLGSGMLCNVECDRMECGCMDGRTTMALGRPPVRVVRLSLITNSPYVGPGNPFSSHPLIRWSASFQNVKFQSASLVQAIACIVYSYTIACILYTKSLTLSLIACIV